MVVQKTISVDQLLDDFQSNKTWDKKYRLLIQIAKKLPEFSENEKNSGNQITACESLAWLLVEKKEAQYYFKMDSDARVVKGFMMILSILLQGKTGAQIVALDIHDFFAQLGLLNHLSPSRANGLLAIINKIKEVVLLDAE